MKVSFPSHPHQRLLSFVIFLSAVLAKIKKTEARVKVCVCGGGGGVSVDKAGSVHAEDPSLSPSPHS
jgi:ribose 5-phosphate isomerase RpiB